LDEEADDEMDAGSSCSTFVGRGQALGDRVAIDFLRTVRMDTCAEDDDDDDDDDGGTHSVMRVNHTPTHTSTSLARTYRFPNPP
jgi:hypothetical protein